MKKIITLLSICVVLISGSVFASFPIKTVDQNQTTEIENKISDVKSLDNSLVTSKPDLKEIKKNLKSMKKESKKGSSKGSNMELLILLLLWLFVGSFAAHRWYAGKPVGWNILYILTLGGCGIWAIVDLIYILTGKFN